jgi:hypothetical protein
VVVVDTNKKVLLYLIKKLKEKRTFTGKVQIMKLMFLIDHYDLNKEKLTKNSFLGNEYYIYYLGPFSFEVSEDYDNLKEETCTNELDEKIKEKVDKIIEKFGMYNGEALQEITLEMLKITPKDKGKFMGLKVNEILKN